MLTKFLFWNINGKGLEPLVAALAHERDIDVAILAECTSPFRILEQLNEAVTWQYNYHARPVPIRGVEFFSRFPYDGIQALGDDQGYRLTFRRLLPTVGQDILLVGVHLPSKLHMSSDEQTLACTYVMRQIAEYEARLGHHRTVVVGDLNMDPFEPGLIGAAGLHAVASRQVAQRQSRQVRGETYQFFYNPMWGHFGDRNFEPAGTYFYDSASMITFFWHMFDQVLVRPALLPSFPENSVEIVTTIAGRSLLIANGQPNHTYASDHLPIIFALDLLEDTDGR